MFCGQHAFSAGSSSAAQNSRSFVNRSIYCLALLGSLVLNITMDLSSLNVDVLLYLMEFVDPVDRFNLVLSGILRGFENANEGIDLNERYSQHFTSVSSSNHIVICSESTVVELNWGYVVVASAN